jgi:hypothetical protein
LKLTRDRSSWELVGDATPAAAFWGAASICRAAEALADYIQFMDVMFPYEPPKHAFHDPPWMLTEVVPSQPSPRSMTLRGSPRNTASTASATHRCANLHDELREQSRLRQSTVP